MYVDKEARPAGEVQITKLSQAIRIGALMVPETRPSYMGCALGTAGHALGWRWLEKSTGDLMRLLNERFGLSEEELVTISKRHCVQGGPTRLQIADELEARGL